MEVKVIAQMDNTIDHTFESANRIYDINGIAPTIPTGCGGGTHTEDTFKGKERVHVLFCNGWFKTVWTQTSNGGYVNA